MPTAHEAVAALPDGADADPDLLRALVVGRYLYDLGSDDPEDFTAVDPATGDVPPALAYGNRLYWYDAADSTTAHDGTTCLVSDDGKRFKLEATDLRLDAVASQGDTSPPGSPALGDAYIVGAAATGAWSGHDDDIAVYTAAGWLFLAPRVGRLTYVEDETGYYHYAAGGSWAQGLGSSPIAAGSVTAAVMVDGGGAHYWRIENQTTSSPPGSPAAGDTYIVGPSATGAWSGHDAKIAQWDGAAWDIYTPGQGWLAYDKAATRLIAYDTTDGWVALGDGDIHVSTTTVGSAVAAVEIALPAGFATLRLVVKALRPATASTPLNLRLSDDGGATFEAGASDYTYDCDGTTSTGDTRIVLANSNTDAATAGIYGELSIYGANDAADYTRIVGTLSRWSASNQINRMLTVGAYKTAVVTDALQITANTGNVAAGAVFELYGRVR